MYRGWILKFVVAKESSGRGINLPCLPHCGLLVLQLSNDPPLLLALPEVFVELVDQLFIAATPGRKLVHAYEAVAALLYVEAAKLAVRNLFHTRTARG